MHNEQGGRVEEESIETAPQTSRERQMIASDYATAEAIRGTMDKRNVFAKLQFSSSLNT